MFSQNLLVRDESDDIMVTLAFLERHHVFLKKSILFLNEAMKPRSQCYPRDNAKVLGTTRLCWRADTS